MTTTAVKTQKTQLFVVSGAAVLEVAQVSGMTGLGGGTATDIDTTTLMSDGKESETGLPDNGSLSCDLIFNPADASHQALQAIQSSFEKVQWCIGLSDGSAEPTYTSNTLTPPAARTSVSFIGSIDQLSVDIAKDNVLTGKLSIKISGALTWTQKA